MGRIDSVVLTAGVCVCVCLCLCEKHLAKCLTPRFGNLATVLRCSYSFRYSCSGSLQVQFQVQFSGAVGGAGGENCKNT